MAIRNAAYPAAVATFLDKVDHVSPVIAVDVNALQNEMVAAQTFAGVIGELPPAGAGNSGTTGTLPNGADVLPRITAHIHMLNEWITQMRSQVGASDPIASEALTKANAAHTAAGAAQSTASSASKTASSNVNRLAALEKKNSTTEANAWAYPRVIYKIRIYFKAGKKIPQGKQYVIQCSSLTMRYNPLTSAGHESSRPLHFYPDILMGPYGGGSSYRTQIYPYTADRDSRGNAIFKVVIRFDLAKTIPSGGKYYKAICQVTNYHERGGLHQGGVHAKSLSAGPKTLEMQDDHDDVVEGIEVVTGRDASGVATTEVVQPEIVPGEFTNDDDGTIEIVIP